MGGDTPNEDGGARPGQQARGGDEAEARLGAEERGESGAVQLGESASRGARPSGGESAPSVLVGRGADCGSPGAILEGAELGP